MAHQTSWLLPSPSLHKGICDFFLNSFYNVHRKAICTKKGLFTVPRIEKLHNKWSLLDQFSTCIHNLLNIKNQFHFSFLQEKATSLIIMQDTMAAGILEAKICPRPLTPKDSDIFNQMSKSQNPNSTIQF
ncbi:unnamed protein product [Ilex paraguariensis]|uniref:Uncharacterized protein n=1 Tax=Ilex paraguariensis TaxID=185542 RepID=A0ABC8QZ59_9AQUA